jgi:hypothetical protein
MGIIKSKMIQQIAFKRKETTNNGRDKEIKMERQNPEGKREEMIIKVTKRELQTKYRHILDSVTLHSKKIAISCL